MIAGQGKGHQLSGLKAGDTWLMFGVVFKGEEGMHWVREEALSCDNLVRSCSILPESHQGCGSLAFGFLESHFLRFAGFLWAQTY